MKRWSLEELWARPDVDLEEVAPEQWDALAAISDVRREWNKSEKTDADLVKAVILLAEHTDLPEDLRSKIFTIGLQLLWSDSWDEAFGPLTPKGKHRNKRRQMPEAISVWHHVYLMIASGEFKLTMDTFDLAGEELGISAKACQKLYQEYANDHNQSLARKNFSSEERERAKSERERELKRLADEK